jgi:hypothetical protein
MLQARSGVLTADSLAAVVAAADVEQRVEAVTAVLLMLPTAEPTAVRSALGLLAPAEALHVLDVLVQQRADVSEALVATVLAAAVPHLPALGAAERLFDAVTTPELRRRVADSVAKLGTAEAWAVLEQRFPGAGATALAAGGWWLSALRSADLSDPTDAKAAAESLCALGFWRDAARLAAAGPVMFVEALRRHRLPAPGLWHVAAAAGGVPVATVLALLRDSIATGEVRSMQWASALQQLACEHRAGGWDAMRAWFDTAAAVGAWRDAVVAFGRHGEQRPALLSVLASAGTPASLLRLAAALCDRSAARREALLSDAQRAAITPVWQTALRALGDPGALFSEVPALAHVLPGRAAAIASHTGRADLAVTAILRSLASGHVPNNEWPTALELLQTHTARCPTGIRETALHLAAVAFHDLGLPEPSLVVLQASRGWTRHEAAYALANPPWDRRSPEVLGTLATELAAHRGSEQWGSSLKILGRANVGMHPSIAVTWLQERLEASGGRDGSVSLLLRCTFGRRRLRRGPSKLAARRADAIHLELHRSDPALLRKGADGLPTVDVAAPPSPLRGSWIRALSALAHRVSPTAQRQLAGPAPHEVIAAAASFGDAPHAAVDALATLPSVVAAGVTAEVLNRVLSASECHWTTAAAVFQVAGERHCVVNMEAAVHAVVSATSEPALTALMASLRAGGLASNALVAAIAARLVDRAAASSPSTWSDALALLTRFVRIGLTSLPAALVRSALGGSQRQAVLRSLFLQMLAAQGSPDRAGGAGGYRMTPSAATFVVAAAEAVGALDLVDAVVVRDVREVRSYSRSGRLPTRPRAVGTRLLRAGSWRSALALLMYTHTSDSALANRLVRNVAVLDAAAAYQAACAMGGITSKPVPGVELRTSQEAHPPRLYAWSLSTAVLVSLRLSERPGCWEAALHAVESLATTASATSKCESWRVLCRVVALTSAGRPADAWLHLLMSGHVAAVQRLRAERGVMRGALRTTVSGPLPHALLHPAAIVRQLSKTAEGQ